MDLFPETLKIILLLFPGLVAMIIEEAIIGRFNNKRDSLDKVFMSFLYTILALVITLILYGILNLLLRLLGLLAFLKQPISKIVENCLTFKWDFVYGNISSYISFLIVYIIVSFVSGVILGIFMASQFNDKSLLSRAVNWIRRKLNRPDVISGFTPWDELFCNREMKVVEIVTPDGTSYKGLLSHFTFSGTEVREMAIEGMELVEKWKDYVTKVKYIYYHFDSGTIIKLYDTSELLKANNIRTNKNSKKD